MTHTHQYIKSKIPTTCQVHPYAVIGEGVVLGENVIIHPFVVINDGVTLGDRVEVFPGAYIGKEPKGAGALARQPHFERQVKIGADCSIGPHTVIYYDVEIGSNTLIGDGASIREQCKVGSYCIISRYVTLNYNATVGDRTKIMDMTHVTGNCIIGSDVFISLHVGMANDNQIGQSGYDDHVQGPVICDGAAIGLGAMLLPKVYIGKGAVISASSLVRKSIEANTLVAGNPAKTIKKLRCVSER
ncbi:MAG: transferase [Gammaproteobacteria bacterium]|nr:transferase [Gammaproteobacteria bacterium]